MLAKKKSGGKTKSNLSEKLRVRATHVGKGLFARKPFRKGQMIGEATGRIIVDAEYDSRHCIELSETHVLEPGAPFRYLNHNCDPNCELFSWETDDGTEDAHRVYVAAMRTIRPGDELTIDYAWQAEAAIRCLCSAENCRGWIVDISQLHKVKRSVGRSTGKRRKRA